ncbi:MAG: hypothetical protein P8Y97_03290 [Candidatus Lokiarchaeota archaeon]
MSSSRNIIDKGLVEVDGFELKSECIYHPIKSRYILNIQIENEIVEKIISTADKVILSVRCKETYFKGEYLIDKLELKKNNKFIQILPRELIGIKLEYNISYFNDNSNLIGYSNKYIINLEKPDIDFESEWISFKQHPSYSLYPDLFWVIELPYYDKVKIFWNDDIKNLKPFIYSNNPNHAKQQKQFFAIFGTSLKMVQLFSVFNVVLDDDLIIKNIIEKLPDNNIFYKKDGIDIESEFIDKKLAIFPYLKKENEMLHKGEKNRWLWLANFCQRNNLNILKILTQIE